MLWVSDTLALVGEGYGESPFTVGVGDGGLLCMIGVGDRELLCMQCG